MITLKNLNKFIKKFSKDEAGFTTAELLGNAALGIAALAAIWIGFQSLGTDVIAFIRRELNI